MATATGEHFVYEAWGELKGFDAVPPVGASNAQLLCRWLTPSPMARLLPRKDEKGTQTCWHPEGASFSFYPFSFSTSCQKVGYSRPTVSPAHPKQPIIPNPLPQEQTNPTTHNPKHSNQGINKVDTHHRVNVWKDANTYIPGGVRRHIAGC